VDIVTAIQVAQLALKHRQNKNLRQRIIAYVGSPLGEMVDEKTLVRVGKKLKKNNVALDVIAYGEFENNEQRLRALIDAVQNNDNRYDDFHQHIYPDESAYKLSMFSTCSHFLIIPPGPHLMSDLIRTSPILRDPEAAGADGQEGGGGFEFGFDPSLDPELALVST
jgi:26S proteasome regulatory subunit N10